MKIVGTGATGSQLAAISPVTEDILPDSDDTRDLGSATKQWAILYTVLAFVTSLTIGGFIGLSADGDQLLINNSVQINGSLNVSDNITATNFFGDGSGITGVTAVSAPQIDQGVNTTDSPTFVSLTIHSNEITTDISDALSSATNPTSSNYFATIDDLIKGNLTITTVITIRNDEPVTIVPGAAMRFTGYISGVSRQTAIYANFSQEDWHADCLSLETITSGSSGNCVKAGHVLNVDTSMFTVQDDVFLDSHGNLSNTKPVDANCIQKVGMILRSHASLGVIWVTGTDRCNDVSHDINITGTMNASSIYVQNAYCLEIDSCVHNISYNGTHTVIS